MNGLTSRTLWRAHLWLGLGLLLPWIWWTATAGVFSLWPMATVRSTPAPPRPEGPALRLSEQHLPPAHLFKGALSLKVAPVLERPLALVDRGADQTEVWDLGAARSLGPCLPTSWILALAERDQGAGKRPVAIYLLPRSGGARRVSGVGPDRLGDPQEYTGPRPAYALHYQEGPALHLYLDALEGQVRARRSAVWRAYDFAFRLHSFEFARDGVKRSVQLTVCILGLALGVTGALMGSRKLRTSAPNR